MMRRDRSEALPLAGAVGAVIAVACCAGLPALAAVLGGFTLAVVMGVSGGVLVATATIATAVLAVRSRRRRRCDPPTRRPAP